MKNKRLGLRTILLLLLLIVVLLAVFLLTDFWRAPLDAVLNLDTSGGTFCGHSAPMQVLFLLTDRSDGGTSDRLLALRLIEADFPNQTVASIYFPKELNLTIVALSDVGFDQIRLDEIYRVGLDVQDNNVAAATNLVAQALYDTFGVRPDYYVTLDLDQFTNLIDAVGGVDVEIMAEYNATDAGLGYFHPGVLHMTGELALAFSEATTPLARWDGFERQTQVLKGLREAALEPSNLLNAPELIQSFRQAVTTDLSPELGMDLICLAEAVAMDQITFYGVDDTYVVPNMDGSLAPRGERVAELLLEAFGN